MTDILVKPQELRQAAEQLRTSAKKISGATDDVARIFLASAFKMMFSGNRSMAILMRFMSRSGEIARFDDLVLKFASNLDEVANAFEQADKKEILDKFQVFMQMRRCWDPNASIDYVGYPREGFNKWLADQLGFTFSEITSEEADLLDKLVGDWGIGYDRLIEFASCANDAYKYQSDFFSTSDNMGSFNDNAADAFRHAYWSARLTKAFGADWAQRFTDAHEDIPNNPAARDFMDRWNNSLGIKVATENPNLSNNELAKLILEEIRNGKGIFIAGADQYGIDSPERAYLAENGPLEYTY